MIEEHAPGGKINIWRDCGCESVVDLIQQKARIKYCPIHKAAPDLLALCEYTLSLILKHHKLLEGEPAYSEFADLNTKLVHLIVKAKG